jgi:hypothetical protein
MPIWSPLDSFALPQDPYSGGPTVENANLLNVQRMGEADNVGLETPFIDPVNILAGGAAGLMTGGLPALAQLPGMVASEVPIGLMLEKADEYSGSNPIVNTVAGLALPMLAGRYLEPHVNEFWGQLANDLAQQVDPNLRTFNQLGIFLGPNAKGADLPEIDAVGVDNLLPEYATIPEKIEFYIKQKDNKIDKYDIISFDDATFFKQPDGSYIDNPVKGNEDMSFDSLFDIRREAENSYDGKLSDYTLSNTNFWEKYKNAPPEKVKDNIVDIRKGLMR